MPALLLHCEYHQLKQINSTLRRNYADLRVIIFIRPARVHLGTSTLYAQFGRAARASALTSQHFNFLEDKHISSLRHRCSCPSQLCALC